MIRFLSAFVILLLVLPTPVGKGQDAKVLQSLKDYLAETNGDFAWKELASQAFAKQSLDAPTAKAAKEMLTQHHAGWVEENRGQEMEDLVIQVGEHKLPFWYKVYGDKPEGGRSLFISMHGGGGAPKRVNDQQWENQKKLYTPYEGVYVAPRAPVDAWNMWHVPQVDALFQQLVEDMIVFEDVNPDRVYLMGYSAGGDGVYQIAPRWADHLAAAAMMAGHPNETTPDGLRNLPFCLQMGGKDAAFDRNKIAGQWEEKLKKLQEEDPQGYPHLVKIYPNYGHWMNREDAIAVPWMAKFQRNLFPERIIWKQDDVTHPRFYWLRNDAPKAKARIVADWDGQHFTIGDHSDMEEVSVLLDDQMPGLKMDQDIKISVGQQHWEVQATRTIGNLAQTLWESGDPKMMMSGRVRIKLPPEDATQAEVVTGDQ